MKSSFSSLAVIALLLVVPLTLEAAVSVRPFLLEEVVEPRSIVTKEIQLTNQLNRKITVYATVNEIALGIDGDIKEFIAPVMTDRTNTVTSWIEIGRGRIEINPGETVTVPATIRVHPLAQPGDYYAFIGFFATNKRFEAEAAALRGDASGTIVKVSIADTTNESLRIKGFYIDRLVVRPDSEMVVIEVENLGDVPLTPAGEIVFYSANGAELTAVPINTEKTTSVDPNTIATLTVPLPSGTSVGRVKANAILEYGKQRATLYDSTYFYMVPLPYLLIALGALGALTILLIIVLYRSHRDEYDSDGDEVPLYVKNGHDGAAKDHDITITPHSK